MPHVTQVWGFKGTTLGHGTASTGPFTTIAQRVSIGGPSLEVGTRETTNLDSSAKTFAPTLLDGGEVTCSIEWDPADATHTTLMNQMLTPPVPSDYWQVGYPDTTKIVFQAIVTKFEAKEGTVEDNLTADVTFKVSGIPTITYNLA